MRFGWFTNLTDLYLQCLNVQKLSPHVQPYLNNFWVYHRVYRVPSFLSSRPNWDSLTPHLQASEFPPSFGSGGGGGGLHTRLQGRPNSDEGTDTVVL